MILQSKIDINPTENAGELHDKLMHLGSELVLKPIQAIEKGNLKTTIQPLKETKTAYKLNKDNCKVDWNSTLDSYLQSGSRTPSLPCGLGTFIEWRRTF